jgi:hypothetical protein
MSASMAARRYFTVLSGLDGHRRQGAILAYRLRSRFHRRRHREVRAVKADCRSRPDRQWRAARP